MKDNIGKNLNLDRSDIKNVLPFSYWSNKFVIFPVSRSSSLTSGSLD